MLSGHGSVDLGGRQIGMSKQILNRPQVGPSFQEVGGKAMSQGMGEGGQPVLDHSPDPPGI
jgi:hypothetical protein